MPPPLVLASSSPWRAQMLRDAGIPCEALAAPIDEDTVRINLGPLSPRDLALALATAKARSVANLRPDALVLGADQVAHLDGEAFGKPRDPADHRVRLRSLRGRTHTLSTGVALLGGRAPHSLVVDTHLTFRSDITDDEIDAYVASGDGTGCAGGYRAEGPGAQLIERIDGDWFNVIGLPLLPVIGVLRDLGWRPTFQVARDPDTA